MRPVAEGLERLLPPLFVAAMEGITGHRAQGRGLGGFVEHSRAMGARPVAEQRAFGGRLLRRLAPAPLLAAFRGALGVVRGLHPGAHAWIVRFGASTVGTAAVYWLVGESRLMSPEEESALVEKLRGEDVHVSPAGVLLLRKCTFMEESGGCKNLCLNLCKAGTEEFMANELGMPLRLHPDFTDHSCRILLLQDPVPPEDDPAFSWPCGAEQCDQQFRHPLSCESDSEASARLGTGHLANEPFSCDSAACKDKGCEL